MKCPGCEYELWNLKAGPCPECGRPFKPSDFDFLPNAVKFCCPHCAQEYYGTSEHGQLVPTEFDCVSCGQHVHVDDMLLLPADALGKREPTRATNPWLDPSRKGFRRWVAAAASSLGQPGKVLEATPAIGSSGKAMSFAMCNFAVAGVLSLGCATFALVTGSGAGMMVFMTIFALLVPAAYMFVWVLVTHGCLKLLRQPTPDGLSRTFQAIAFTSGAWLMALVPCMGSFLGFTAWAICAPIAVMAAHKIKPWPAVIATIAFPVVVAIGVVAFYVVMIFGGLNAAQSAAIQARPPVPTSMPNWAPGTDINMGTQRVANVIRRRARAGSLPTHVAYLASDSEFDPVAFYEQSGGHSPRVGTWDLFTLSTLDTATRNAELDQIVANWPSDVTAHRVGRLLMTYHGMDAAWQPNVWLLVQLPDDPSEDYWAITLSGFEQIDRAAPQAFIDTQNTVRAAAGLDPLPEMTTILSTPGPWTAADGAPMSTSGGP